MIAAFHELTPVSLAYAAVTGNGFSVHAVAKRSAKVHLYRERGSTHSAGADVCASIGKFDNMHVRFVHDSMPPAALAWPSWIFA